MTTNIEHGPMKGQEDFVLLLEQSLASTSWNTVLVNKEGDNTGLEIAREQAVNRFAVKDGRDIPEIWNSGIRRIHGGLFNDAYTNFDSILRSGLRLKPETEFRIVTRMLDACVGQVGVEENSVIRLHLVNRGYHVYDRLKKYDEYQFDPVTRAVAFSQYASLIYRHSFLVDDVEEKKALIAQGFNELSFMRKLLSSPDANVRYLLHSSVGFLSSYLFRLDPSAGRYGGLLERWYEAERTAAEVAITLDRPGSATFHFFSAALACAQTAEGEELPRRKLNRYQQAHDLSRRGLKLTSFAHLAAPHEIGFVARMTFQLANLDQDVERQDQHLLSCYKLNMQAAELSGRNGNPESALYYLIFCAYSLDRLAKRDEKNKEYQKKEQLNLFTQAVDVAQTARNLPKRIELLSITLKMMDVILDQVKESSERKQLLKKKLEGHLLSARLSQELAKQAALDDQIEHVRHVAFALGYAGSIESELVIIEGDEESRERAYNHFMESAELGFQAGEREHTSRMLSLAGNRASEIAENQKKRDGKVAWFKRSYEARTRAVAIDMTFGDYEHAAFELGFVAMVTQKLAEENPQNRNNWSTFAWEANIKAAELFLEINDIRRAANCFKIDEIIARRMIEYFWGLGETRQWQRRRNIAWNRYLEITAGGANL